MVKRIIEIDAQDHKVGDPPAITIATTSSAGECIVTVTRGDVTTTFRMALSYLVRAVRFLEV